MVAKPPPPELPRLLGRSPALTSVRRLLERAAHVDAPVILEGETGTGKSLAARWIHARSPRREGPFVGVNCAGIPDALFESEFFGHRRGAFTGAVEDRPGLFEAAAGGTLFLDEVAELPALQQAKLLTVLEERRVRRVGEARLRPVDVRVVAATSTELDRAVRDGAFRADLFHRLALLRCTLPPLRERDGDAALLAATLLDRLGRKHLGVPARLTPAGLRAVAEHPWPGNVRELAHALEAALILAQRATLDRRHLDEVLRPVPPPPASPNATEGNTPGSPTPDTTPPHTRPPGEAGVTPPSAHVRTTTEASTNGSGRPPDDGLDSGRRYSFHGTPDEEAATIREALVRFRGNRTRAARHLGMSRGTLRDRIRRYDL